MPGVRRVVLAARFGDLRRTTSLTSFGFGRGTPVDRFYITDYVARHADLVVGRVLEVKEDLYATRFGADVVEVVDVEPTNDRADIVGDLCDPGTLTPGRYDTAVVTQTLQYVSDPAAAVRNLYKSLRPGGSLVLTVPCVSRLAGSGDLWRWTPAGLATLLQVAVPAADRDRIECVGAGNGLAARAFLFGLAAEDLPRSALQVRDEQYPLVVCALIRRPS
jgi:SAM-dependent methyltransferase